MYLTYDEYTVMGGKYIDEIAYEQIEFEARVLVDWWTFNRLQKETEYPEAVKRCMFKIISLIVDKQKAMVVDTASTDDGSTKAGIASESNDGVSTSYNVMSAREAVDTLQMELEHTIKLYLIGVKNSLGRYLLYRGLYPNE
jgi:hypothetical protein